MQSNRKNAMDIFITIDFDHINCNNQKYETNEISFNYKTELIRLKEYLSTHNITPTCFVRIDQQIKDLFGDSLYVYYLLDEIGFPGIRGWHPHLYQKIDGKYQPTMDSHLACRQLRHTFYETTTVQKLRHVRIGGALMTNQIMSALDHMGFQVDSSALPGVHRKDAHRLIQWKHAGNTPYQPSFWDYQCAGEPHFKIWEIPMTTIPIVAPYDKCLQRRYINPTIRKEIFQQSLTNWISYLTQIVVVFHPDQIMEGYQDDLYHYGWDNFVANMSFLMKYNPTFKTL